MDLKKRHETDWESLSISNDFLFGKIMQDAEICKELLQIILPDLDIDHVEYPELQKSICQDADAKSVRLDVYVKDDKRTVYNIEMQATDVSYIPKRSRYYQSMIDLQLLDRGDVSYARLNRSYIIFICTFDLFHQGRHIYTFENYYKEDKRIVLGDDTTKIFLNAAGEMDDVSGQLKAFLDYVAGKRPDDVYIDKLERAVSEAKRNRKWRHEYMTLQMRDQLNIEKGIEQGIEQATMQMVENALLATNSVKQTAQILKLTEQEVRRIAEKQELSVDD